MARASAVSKGHNWRLKVFTRALIQMEGLHIPRLEPVLFDLIIIYMNFHRLLRNVLSEPLDGFWNNMKSELNVEDNHVTILSQTLQWYYWKISLLKWGSLYELGFLDPINILSQILQWYYWKINLLECGSIYGFGILMLVTVQLNILSQILQW